MILLVLLHKGKGGGLSDMFGGGISCSLGGSSVVERNLDRLTVRTGVVWFACIIGLGLLEKRLQLAVHRTAPARGPTGPSRSYTWQVATRSVAAESAPARWARPSAATRPPASRLLLVRQRARDAPSFAEEPAWPCPRCGTAPAAAPRRPGPGNPPSPHDEPYKTHLAYVKERRSDDGRPGDPGRGAAVPARPRPDPLRRRLADTHGRQGLAGADRARGHVGRGVPVQRARVRPGAAGLLRPAPAADRRPTARGRPRRPCPRRRRGTRRPGGAQAGNVREIRVGGGWASRGRRSRCVASCSAGCSGKSDATWASGPTPSISTSNSGTSRPGGAAAASSRRSGRRGVDVCSIRAVGGGHGVNPRRVQRYGVEQRLSCLRLVALGVPAGRNRSSPHQTFSRRQSMASRAGCAQRSSTPCPSSRR